MKRLDFRKFFCFCVGFLVLTIFVGFPMASKCWAHYLKNRYFFASMYKQSNKKFFFCISSIYHVLFWLTQFNSEGMTSCSKSCFCNTVHYSINTLCWLLLFSLVYFQNLVYKRRTLWLENCANLEQTDPYICQSFNYKLRN